MGKRRVYREESAVNDDDDDDNDEHDYDDKVFFSITQVGMARQGM